MLTTVNIDLSFLTLFDLLSLVLILLRALFFHLYDIILHGVIVTFHY